MTRVFLLVALVAFIPVSALAQELSPRAYWPAPTDTQVLTLGYAYTKGDTLPDPSLPITGIDSDIDSLKVAYSHTVDLFGRSSNMQFEIPYSNGVSRAEVGDLGNVERQYEGVGDVSATVSLNLMGAPAMSPKDFAELRAAPRPILGASLKVVAPTGEYDKNRVLNVGANRWAAKAELGYIKAISHKWLFESQLGAWVFGDNDEFLGQKKQQEPIVSLQAHLVHRFRPGLWASLNATAYRGGRSKVGGDKLDDLQRDLKLGATVVLPLSKGNVLRLGYSTGSLNDNDESFNVFSVAYSKVF